MITAIDFYEKSAASLKTLENVWRKTIKNKGTLIRRDASSFDPLAKPIAKAMGGKMGPATYAKDGTSIGQIYPKNKRGTFAISGNSKKAIDKSTELQGMTPVKSTAKSNRSINAVVNNHEGNEAQMFAKRKPATLLGMGKGHHSVSNIIGREHNALVQGSKKVKKAIPAMRKARKNLENQDMKELMPLGVGGKKIPFEYGKSPRLNRRMIRAMYDKELGIPLNYTKQNRHAMLKATQKAEMDVYKNHAKKNSLGDYA